MKHVPPPLLPDVRVGLDFHEHVGIDQTSDADHGGSRTNVVEKLTVGTTNLFPVSNIAHKGTRAYHIFHARPCFFESGLNILEGLKGLRVRVTHTHDLSVRPSCGSSGNMHVGTNLHRTRVTDNRLPGSTTGDVLAFAAQRNFLLADHSSGNVSQRVTCC